MSKQKKSAKTSAPVTAKELKAWIEGIHAFQPKEWTPSREQWAAVCEKIANLQEVEDYGYDTVAPQTPVYAPAYSGPSALSYNPDAPVAPSGGALGGIAAPQTGLIDAKPVPTDGQYVTGFA